MGVLYSVYPLGDEMRAWLDEFDIPHDDVSDGRPPTPNDAVVAVEALGRTDIERSESVSSMQFAIGLADTDEEPESWTLFNIEKITAPDGPAELGFEKGTPELNARIVWELAKLCGPLVLIAEDDPPALITADTDFDQLIKTWDHIPK